MNVLEEIRKTVRPGTSIPKPKARGTFIVKGWGMRRNEQALIYYVPNHVNPSRPTQKGVTESELVKAHRRLSETGEFTSEWFQVAMTRCSREGSTNFTTIGGVFELLGKARYAGRGVYRKT